ncbi:unnamed protein product [Cuscuta epithymum]|uniref:Uncharacterized protein n=1 Tax=Cuscuta epithymum TaxID=186058 RepID=A0AAV0D175_9ASTE|nr:unnamed protein product [Cuscuta epithymum]
MDGGGKVTRRNPTGRAPVATGQGSRGASRVCRGASRGGRSHTVSDGHVDTEEETYWSYEDSTYQPETEPVETPYEGDDDDVSDEEGENDSLARIEALLQQYQREREERRERRRRRGGRTSGGASRGRSHGNSRAHIEPHGGRDYGGPIIRISKFFKEARDLGCKPDVHLS